MESRELLASSGVPAPQGSHPIRDHVNTWKSFKSIYENENWCGFESHTPKYKYMYVTPTILQYSKSFKRIMNKKDKKKYHSNKQRKLMCVRNRKQNAGSDKTKDVRDEYILQRTS